MVRLSTMGRKFIFFLLVDVVTFAGIESYNSLTYWGRNVESVPYYTKEKYVKNCGFWNFWRKCSHYKKKIEYRLACKRGYSSYHSSDCPHAICDGRITLTGACNQHDYVEKKHPPGSMVLTASNGKCSSPERCTDCGINFYGSGPRCIKCPSIPYCYEEQCSSIYDNECANSNCHGEKSPYPYWRAYTPEPSKSKKCEKACSWRKDSTRCYPGRCEHELASRCKCHPGFSGTHCEIMTDYAQITYNECKLEAMDPKIDPSLNPRKSSIVSYVSPVWTHITTWDKAKTKWVAKYTISSSPPPPATSSNGSHHYVTRFEIGIIQGSLELSHVSGNVTENIAYNCDGLSERKPVAVKTCEKTFEDLSFHFGHNDTLYFILNVKIGGYLTIINREDNDNIERFSYVGTTKTVRYQYRWDLETPYHCLEKGTACPQPVSVPDLSERADISMTWNGWIDDLSGIEKYEYEVQTLILKMGVWSENGIADGTSRTTLYNNSSIAEFKLPNSGIFSVLFSALDKAGNRKIARRIILYDPKSVVTTKPTASTHVVTASKNTTYKWVVKNTNTVTVNWVDRFRNAAHEGKSWLSKIEIVKDIERSYDDYSGKRTVDAVNNIHGCVDFQVSYVVGDGMNIRDSRPLTSVSDITTETDKLHLVWSDGDRVNITVKAIDIFDKSVEESVIIYRDATPPHIEELWLTRGNRLNVSVHRMEDFAEMTIEWIAYDYHSGIDSIYWRLFDNFTGEDILRGKEHIQAQGNTDTLVECNSRYASSSRGARCYKTPYMGAFHQHFQVKPAVKHSKSGCEGLCLGMDQGIHDSDYYIEISATNKARLSTVLHKKITIDISPPHTGIVLDGIKGSKEVDFQQSKTLHVHWDGFFDRESGVSFYQYGFSKAPIAMESFVLDNNSSEIHETYSLEATHTVSAEGKYYACVVAYNRALEPSLPVCSDGVTVTTVIPAIKHVIIDSASIRGGLVTDTSRSSYWVVGRDRIRKRIKLPNGNCKTKAVQISDIDLLPIAKHQNGSIVEVDGGIFCSNTSGVPASLGLVLTKSSHVNIRWSPVDGAGGIHDYEIGLSSTPDDSAPDILPFESTKQHPHVHLMHTDVPDGTEFYIIIKSISRANVEGKQTIGPCYMDTSGPEFTPPIKVKHSNGFIIASWTSETFTDDEDPYPLELEFAIGHNPRGVDVQGYRPLNTGDSCTEKHLPYCTATDISKTDWLIHGHHTYYLTIKAENLAGIAIYAVSEPYVHDVLLASHGLVFDIAAENDSSIPILDIEDIDFTSNKRSLSARWIGFSHPHLEISYKFSVGTTPGAGDTVSPKDIGQVLSYTETGLSLIKNQTYYVTITAVTSAGNVEVTSDGVLVVPENAAVLGLIINDGEPCNVTAQNNTDSRMLFKHHDKDNRMSCELDVDYQSSTNVLSAHWDVPAAFDKFTPDAHFSIQMRNPGGGNWSMLSQVGLLRRFFLSGTSDCASFRTCQEFRCRNGFILGNETTPTSGWSMHREYEYIHGHNEARVTDAILNPGRTYRFVVKLCARSTCFSPVSSDGVTILANPPQTGKISIKHENSTLSHGKEKLVVSMDRFYDPDVLNQPNKYDVVEKYEWAITDGSDVGRTHTVWTEIQHYRFTHMKTVMEFDIELKGQIDFSKCRRISVRGFNKAKLSSYVSGDIRDCSSYDPVLIRPKVVIDAVGKSDLNTDGYGEPIILQTNARWSEPDRDYTPNMNYISAVWPQLRYKSYIVAVLNAKSVDATTFYLPSSSLSLQDPCGHPDAMKCATTDHEFINVKFEKGELVHGERYMVCIHTEQSEIQYEKWTQILPELNECSDGIVVDFSPPVAGNVWIGHEQGMEYQMSTTSMYVNWNSFQDVEESGKISHASGIQDYQLGIGTTYGGNDILAFHSVGVVNHVALYGLMLISGQRYYATIKATDFANRTTTQSSDAVLIDTTPPSKTNRAITMSGRHIVSNTEIDVCWSNVFKDPESDIEFYMWSIGSQPGYDDILEFTKTIEDCGFNDETNPLDIREGHAYYISVKAYNKAGLMSIATSWAYTVDLSAPRGGYVYDGKPAIGSNMSDLDFQRDTSTLYASWEGFHDSHSAIKEYYISVGTCPECEDVVTEQDVGIVYDFRVDHVHVGVGLTYYTTVTACNTADFCTTVTSDGIIMDNSPPSAGEVTDGVSTYDLEYQSIRSVIGATWYGFVDPQSGISKYEWCAGTFPGDCDVMSRKELHVTEISSTFNVTPAIPVNQRIFVTVRAYNKAGMFTDSSSNGFLVDVTAPLITRGPRFSRDYSISGTKQYYRTSIKVEWDVNDDESSIQRQYLSVKSHIGGYFRKSSIKVNGIARNYILTGLKLHDGVEYYVNLISCNGAKICSSKVSSGLLVDGTPPTRGMFAIKTDHAGNPNRHVEGYMTWSKYFVNLAWLGFADIHSDVAHYFVNIGTKFMGADLNEVPEIARQINHNTTGEDRYDEGKVQTGRIKTAKLDASIKHLYISMWAVNKVELSSAIIHSQFLKIPGGSLSLVRRCSASICDGHCVCSPQDMLCHSNATCQDITDANMNNLINVNDVMHGTADIDYTPLNDVLQGHWSIVQRQGLHPEWYEWSVGFSDKDSPHGIFDKAKDRVWHDAGQLMSWIYTTPSDFLLEEDVRYSFFVKVWYGEDKYAIFKSDGVIISTGKPTTTTQHGSAVTEKMLGSAIKDQDYMKNGFPFMVDWKNKFVDAKYSIKSFHVYISTYPGGHDIWDSMEDVTGAVTSHRVERIKLTPGVEYFCNVIGHGYSGIHHTESSDGFKTDNMKPNTGIVYDGIGLHDREYQNMSSVVAGKWHGFTDIGSGIRNYYWCVGNTSTVNTDHAATECSIKKWENVGMHVSVSRKLVSSLKQGLTYYNKIYAKDNVNFKSNIAVSDGVTVDTTPPEPEYLYHEGVNLAQNPSFENATNFIDVQNVNSTNICQHSTDFCPTYWTLSKGSCASIIYSAKNLARNGKTFLFIRGSLHQPLYGLKVGDLYCVTVFTSHLLMSEASLSNKEGFVMMGSTKHVFLLYTKAYRHDEHQQNQDREIVSWHKHTFYFTASATSSNISIGSMDRTTGLFIDHLMVEHVERNTKTESQGGHVKAHVVYLHDWGSIHGSWSFVEDASSISEYMWAIGYTRGGTQLQEFRSVGLSNFEYNANITLVHNSYIYVTSTARNAAGLYGISHSEPVLVDLTPPDIIGVFDGRILGEDQDAWTDNEISINWVARDKESGLDFCEWAIGYQPEGIDLQPFTKISVSQTTVFKDIEYQLLENRTIYSTLRCENNAGLLSSKSTNGVKVSMKPPIVQNAVVEVVPSSVTEYSAADHYQSVTDSVRIRWTGFKDYVGIEQYKLTFKGESCLIDEKMSFPSGQEVLAAKITNLKMPSGLKNITVQAISKLLLPSERISSNVTVAAERPMTSSKQNLEVSWHSGKKEVTVSWDGIFSSSFHMYYEVSAGKVTGGADILQWQETIFTKIKFGLPESITDWSNLHVHILVRAVSVGGKYNVAVGTIQLPASK